MTSETPHPRLGDDSEAHGIKGKAWSPAEDADAHSAQAPISPADVEAHRQNHFAPAEDVEAHGSKWGDPARDTAEDVEAHAAKWNANKPVDEDAADDVEAHGPHGKRPPGKAADEA